jgi:hypothetical protein
VISHHTKLNPKKDKSEEELENDKSKQQIRVKSIGKETKEQTEKLALKIMKSNRKLLMDRLRKKSTE